MGNYSLLLATFRPFGRSIMLPSPSTVSLLAAALNNRFTGDFFLLSCSAAEQLMLTLKSLSFCIFISTCFDKQDQFTPQSGCARLSAALCRYHCKPNPAIVIVSGIQTGESGIGAPQTVQWSHEGT